MRKGKQPIANVAEVAYDEARNAKKKKCQPTADGLPQNLLDGQVCIGSRHSCTLAASMGPWNKSKTMRFIVLEVVLAGSFGGVWEIAFIGAYEEKWAITGAYAEATTYLFEVVTIQSGISIVVAGLLDGKKATSSVHEREPRLFP